MNTMQNSPLMARIVNRITTRNERDNSRAISRWEACKTVIPGWSTPTHYAFFEACAEQLPNPASVLVCGVYHGLDLALMNRAFEHAQKLPPTLIGVDLFSGEPCADWTPEQRAKGSWEDNGFGPGPSEEAAKKNAPNALIIKADSISAMEKLGIKVDLVYLDTSHDYETVKREIIAAMRILATGGVIAGDDYHEPNTHWGVDRAVSEMLPRHVALWNRIWISAL